MTETKTTTASIRIMRSENYCNFEIALTLENPDGISGDEIDKAREEAQALTNEAVKQYRKDKHEEAIPAALPFKKERQVIKVTNEPPAPKPIKDNAEISEIEKLPLYVPPLKQESTKSKTKVTKAKK